MVVGKMGQHLVPRSRNIVLLGLTKLSTAQETGRACWTGLPSEMGENMSLEEADIGERFFAVEELKGTDQICVWKVSHRDPQNPILRLKQVHSIECAGETRIGRPSRRRIRVSTRQRRYRLTRGGGYGRALGQQGPDE